MKKLLSIAFCAAAAMSFAVEVEVASVGVTEITIPSGQQNTIIASSFNALGGSTGVTVANLIKTATGLSDGDQLMLFRDGTYYTFNWSTSSGSWSENTSVASSEVKLTDGIGTTLTVGEGLWLIRKSTDGEVNLYLYGTTPTSTTSTTSTSVTTAGAWNLIGNPTASTFTFSDTTGTKGDQIIVVSSGKLCSYVRKSSGWYQSQNDGTLEKGNPTVAPGIGIWYNPKSAESFDWSGSSN